ncbi:phage major capsid protein [Clostridium beijerinckii]|uniref:phage major capsid protein n=1 Tax=Clostridium beijerinckii TaxID=1520 RepID=UPI0014948DA6|nr:phage major capsid protein [Clostridium beijerinckii]NOW07850.1 HK97 family phage major capsid protein [Clostridium beijerinckii]NYC05481.1 HK97 family phage major capsid protein [Clostridium beijerinckii]
MKLTQKEIAELKREQTELEAKRSELKEKCKNHRDMSVEDLNGTAENIRSISARLDEIGEKLKDAPVEKRGGLGMLKDLKGNEITEENYRSSAKYRDAFYRSFLNNKVSEEDSEIMAFGKRSVTSMNGEGVTTGSEYLVPETTLNKVYYVIKQYGKLYSAITKFGFTGDVSLPIGNVDSPTEDKADGSSELTFSFTEVKISQMAVVATITVKNLLLRNSIPAFEQYLSVEIGKYIGLLCENYVLNGTLTTSTFEGIITALKAAPSVAKTYSVLDWKGIAGIMGGVESPYGDNATWVMKRSTFFNKFFALTDSTGKPIVTVTPLIQGQPGQDNFGTATPYLIAGQPVIFTSQMPDADSILYGDLSTYIVNESESFTIESNTSEKFSEDKTVWRGKLYSGGKGTFPKETFVYYSYNAS